jgi:hypothetical protein
MYDDSRSDRFPRDRTMHLFHSRSLAVALAGWHLLLGSAGYSLHIFTGDCERSRSETPLACACGGHADHRLADTPGPEAGEAAFVGVDRDRHRHDPHNCLLCRWLSQPRVSLWFAVSTVAAHPLATLPMAAAAAPATRRPHPYGARAPPALTLAER